MSKSLVRLLSASNTTPGPGFVTGTQLLAPGLKSSTLIASIGSVSSVSGSAASRPSGATLLDDEDCGVGAYGTWPGTLSV